MLVTYIGLITLLRYIRFISMTIETGKTQKAQIRVTGMTCATCAATVAKAPATSEYKGKKYYFCAVGCKKAFDANPEKYLNSK